MALPLNPAIAATDPPAVAEAFRWLADVIPHPDRPLINISQAAPTAPPPEGLRRALANLIMNDPSVHLYGPDLGFPELRDELARADIRALRRHGQGRAGRHHRGLQPGLHRRHRHPCRTRRRGDSAGAVVLQSQDVARHERHNDRAAGHRRRPDPRPRTCRRPDHRPHPRHRAGNAEQPWRRRVPRRDAAHVPRSGARARHRADRRRDLPRFRRPRRRAA